MSENAVAVTEQPDLSLSEWHSRQDIVAYSRRIKTMLPGGNKLSDIDAMALAQYALAMGLNPFRGEVYGYVDKRGKFTIVDGYKALVRWAHWRMPYTHSFEDMPADDPELPENAIGVRCFVLREDNRALLFDLVKAGATFAEAKSLATTSGVGVVTAADRTDRDGRPIHPPTGWTWQQVARKRALKNTLNQSHGMPSPVEIQNSMGHEEWVMTAGNLDVPSERDTSLIADRACGSAKLFKAEVQTAARAADTDAEPDPAILDAVWGVAGGEPDDADELLSFFGVADPEPPDWVRELRTQAEQSPGGSDPIPAKSATR